MATSWLREEHSSSLIDKQSFNKLEYLEQELGVQKDVINNLKSSLNIHKSKQIYKPSFIDISSTWSIWIKIYFLSNWIFCGYAR